MRGRRIVVTGAAGVLGSAVVNRLAELGAVVIGIDLALDAPDLKSATFVGGVDLTDPSSLANANVLQGKDSIDGLVNIAGGFKWETLGDGSVESWDAMYRINLRTAVAACNYLLPALRAGKGAIVNIGAAATLKAGQGMGAYTASKSGIARLTEALADEEKDNDVRVNAILPSIIDTPANRADMPDADISRWVTPSALADVVVFLLSESARAITGACIPVTGRT